VQRGSVKLLVFLLLSYVGTYVALRKVAGDAFSTYGRVCATHILSPALIFVAVGLVELVSARGTGFAGAMLVAVVGLPLALLALVALFFGGLVGWVRLGVSAAAAPVATAAEPLCSRCGHSILAHKLSPVVPPQLSCSEEGCTCVLHSEASDHAP
jgi:hypothetical protein